MQCFVVGMLTMLATATLRGQSTTTTSLLAIHQYQRDSWRSADGLPAQSVGAIEQTADGYLWLAAGQRIIRFDGVRFTTALGPDSVLGENKRMETRTPILGTTDAKGQLWVTYEGGKLLRYADSKFRQVAAYDSLMLFGPMVPAPTTNGGLWVVFRDEVYRWQDGKYTPAQLNGAPIKGVSALATDSAGVRYVGFRDGRILRSDGRSDTWLKLPSARPASVFGMHASGNGTLWIQYLNTIVRWKDGTTRRVSPPDTTAIYSALTPDNTNGVWVAAGSHGIWHLDDVGNVTSHITPDELTRASVEALRVDMEGSLWVGTTQGLERFRRVPFTTYTIDGGIADYNSIGATWADSQTFWTLGPKGEIRRVRMNPSEASARHNGIIFSSATTTTSTERRSTFQSLTPSAHGAVWIGSANRITRWSPETGATASFGGLDSAGSVFQVLETKSGDVWAMTNRGPYKRIGNTFRKFVATNQERIALPRYWGFGTIYEAMNGHVWIGGGLLVEIANDSLVLYSMKNGLSGQPVQAIHEDRSGTLWAAAGMGMLTRVRDNQATPVSLGAMNAESYFTGVAEDTLGNLWLSGDAGVQRISLRDLNAVADGKQKEVTPMTFTIVDGLPSQSSAGIRSSYVAPNGTLWFAFASGVAMVDPNNLLRNQRPPPVRIEDVVADEHVVSLENATRGLPANTYRVEFHFTGTSLLVPARMRFRYKLEDADKNWTEVGGLTRSATYTRLAPGSYRFRVQAANNDGVWNTEGTSLTFRILPSWYQTWWARTGAVLLVVGIGAIAALTVARVRLGQSEARIHAMMEERTRIAREVHDTLLQGFTGITLQLQGLKGKIRKAPEATEEGVERLLETADATLLAARQAVWEMRPPDLERATLAEALGVALRRTTGDRPALQYRVTGVPRRLPPETEAAVLRIGVEAASNAVKHASANAVDVELTFTRNDVQLCVRDDGCGFDTDTSAVIPGAHFGLVGIRERAKKVGAEVRISSTPGQGTTVLMLAHERNGR